MNVELVSVERKLWSGEASALFARTTEGELGVLPGHMPLLGELVPGWIVRIEREEQPQLRIAVHGGFLSVRKDGVSVLAEVAEAEQDIDVERARQALQRSEGDESPSGVAAHTRALARLRAVGESA